MIGRNFGAELHCGLGNKYGQVKSDEIFELDNAYFLCDIVSCCGKSPC